MGFLHVKDWALSLPSRPYPDYLIPISTHKGFFPQCVGVNLGTIEAMAESPQIRGGALLTSRDKYIQTMYIAMTWQLCNCYFECQYIAVMCEIDVAKLLNCLTATVDIPKAYQLCLYKVTIKLTMLVSLTEHRELVL